MGARIRCFWLEPTDEVQMRLRRFVWSSVARCEGSHLGYHNAEAIIGRDHKANLSELHGDLWPHADPRWPKRCACGYEFGDRDQWQFNPDTLYRRSDTGELTTLHEAPVGAMWDAPWMRGGDYRVVDGITLVVRTPAGEWCVDGPAYSDHKVSNAQGWQRSGKVPDVTARPSIHFPGRWHGFLTNGWLEEC